MSVSQSSAGPARLKNGTHATTKIPSTAKNYVPMQIYGHGRLLIQATNESARTAKTQTNTHS